MVMVTMMMLLLMDGGKRRDCNQPDSDTTVAYLYIKV